jgi:3-hydroxyacyl-[acyl-carrier-protein] dehydratase
VKIDKARFNRIVAPGDQVILDVEQRRLMMKMGLFACQARVDGKVVASAEIWCAERGP